MRIFEMLSPEEISGRAKELYREERNNHKILNGWFLTREMATDVDEKTSRKNPELRAAEELSAIVESEVGFNSLSEVLVGS